MTIELMRWMPPSPPLGGHVDKYALLTVVPRDVVHYHNAFENKWYLYQRK